MTINIMEIIVPDHIIGVGYRRVDTNREKWQEGDEWLHMSCGSWCSDLDGSSWGQYFVRRKVKPKKVWTEDMIACCAEIRRKDLQQEVIDEAVKRVVALFNADDSRWHECRMTSREEAATLSLGSAFKWAKEGNYDFWSKIYRAHDRPSDKWIECVVKESQHWPGFYLTQHPTIGPIRLDYAACYKDFGGYRYGKKWTPSPRFDERRVLVKPDAVRFLVSNNV